MWWNVYCLSINIIFGVRCYALFLTTVNTKRMEINDKWILTGRCWKPCHSYKWSVQRNFTKCLFINGHFFKTVLYSIDIFMYQQQHICIYLEEHFISWLFMHAACTFFYMINFNCTYTTNEQYINWKTLYDKSRL